MNFKYVFWLSVFQSNFSVKVKKGKVAHKDYSFRIDIVLLATKYPVMDLERKKLLNPQLPI